MLQKAIDWLQGKKTIITMVVGSVFSILVASGKVTPDVSDSATKAVADLISTILGGLGLIGTLGGIFASLKGNRIEKALKEGK